MANANDEKTRKTRLIARILREVLQTEHFETLADLTDAVKTSCVRLKIPLDADLLNDAYMLIESNRPLVGEWSQRRGSPTGSTDDTRPLSKVEAADILGKLYLRVKTPSAARVTVRPTDRGPIDIYGDDE